MHSPHDVAVDFLIAPVGVSVFDRCHDYVTGLQKHSLTSTAFNNWRAGCVSFPVFVHQNGE
jgi:hypothetical protein